MEEIYLWMLVSIALGGAGFFIAFTKAIKERNRVLDSLPSETTESILDGEYTPRQELYGPTFVLMMVTVPAFMYTVLGSILISNFGIISDVHLKVAIGGLLALGISSFFANTGRYFIYREVMDGLNEHDSGSKKDFGKYMIFLVHFETPAIFGLVVFIYGLIFSGFLDGETVISMYAADMYFFGTLLFGLTTASTILSGWLFNNVQGPVDEDNKVFSKKILNIAIPQITFVMGLAIAFYLMIEGGMIV